MAGRPPLGVDHVDRIDGSRETKHRLKVVLQTLQGKKVRDACAELGIGETRLRDLRIAVLEAALAALEPRPTGRPPGGRRVDDRERLAALDEQVRAQAERIETQAARITELEQELGLSTARTELALLMPHRYAERAAGAEKKGARQRKRSRPRRRARS